MSGVPHRYLSDRGSGKISPEDQQAIIGVIVKRKQIGPTEAAWTIVPVRLSSGREISYLNLAWVEEAYISRQVQQVLERRENSRSLLVSIWTIKADS